jgi:hypothetical protein
MSLLISYLCIVAISFLASLTVYFASKSPDAYLKLFPPFLLTTLLVEFLAFYLRSIEQSNLAVYNFFTAFEFCFYIWVISLIISNKEVKKIIRVTLLIYAFSAIMNILFIQKMKMFHTVTYSLGCLLIVSFCIYYFLELFRLPNSIKLKNSPGFWICSGLLFYYCCGFPLYGLINFVNGLPTLIIKNFQTIVMIMNIFLYSLFTIAFLCRIKTRKYTLSSS